MRPFQIIATRPKATCAKRGHGGTRTTLCSAVLCKPGGDSSECRRLTQGQHRGGADFYAEHSELLDIQYVRVGKGWTAQMIEMADHIGAYRTLLISEYFGGQQVYIPADPSRSPFLSLVGQSAAETISEVYRRERLIIPTAHAALRSARRAVVLGRVRTKELSKAEAARLLGSARTYVSYLINHTDEGKPPAHSND